MFRQFPWDVTIYLCVLLYILVFCFILHHAEIPDIPMEGGVDREYKASYTQFVYRAIMTRALTPPYIIIIYIVPITC